VGAGQAKCLGPPGEGAQLRKRRAGRTRRLGLGRAARPRASEGLPRCAAPAAEGSGARWCVPRRWVCDGAAGQRDVTWCYIARPDSRVALRPLITVPSRAIPCKL
jgi:hypothetical protein